MPVTFRFGTGSNPLGLDPALVADAESYRITRQILEGLVTVDPTTGAPSPSLALSWQEEQNGLAYTFALRENVTFHDGTPFNADSVCANFTRWFQLPAAARPDSSSVTFQQVFKAFSDNAAASIFKSCTALTPTSVRIELNSRMTGFLQALTLPAFAISSPQALADLAADDTSQTISGHPISSYGLHPVGTGPFEFAGWQQDTVTLRAYPSYWGDKGELSEVNFITYEQPQARLQALNDGKIDGYDLVTPGNFDPLVRTGKQILQRDPFSVMYVGINQQVPILQELKVRQAIAMAVDKETLIRDFFIDGTGATAQVIPPKLSGFNNSVPGLAYDPDKARKTLEESAYAGEPIRFYYPRNVTRAYLPTPEKVYAEISRQLTAVGFTIKPVPMEWSEGYLAAVTSPGDHGLHLMGWNGSYSDPDNFVGPMFGAENGEFGLTDPQLVSKIDRARTLPNGPDRNAAYQSINTQIAQTLPLVPVAFPISALAMSDKVVSYPVSPVLNEVFNRVKLRR
ncbi:MAG: transporter substrate-binding protein [Micrococcaceae bacterium]|nr:transporter substrate-binding protein [Micrococcaceae bacterium]